MEKKLYFISSDPEGRFGCKWLIGTLLEAGAAGWIHRATELTPKLLMYLRSINFPGTPAE